MAHGKPPELPTVVDEAGDTPNWVPILGLCLLAVVGLWVVLAQATRGDEPASAETAIEQAEEAPAPEDAVQEVEVVEDVAAEQTGE